MRVLRLDATAARTVAKRPVLDPFCLNDLPLSFPLSFSSDVDRSFIRRYDQSKSRPSIGKLKSATATMDQQPRQEFKLLEAVKAAIIITDMAGTIRYWNPFAEELYGWSSQEVLGRKIMEITVSAETEPEASAHMASLNSGTSWTGEFQVRCRNGMQRTALVTLSPIFDETGVVTSIVGVSQDLSERKFVEEQLRNTRSELEKRVQERTAELNQANRNLRDLSGRLMQLRDEERRRLARDLHDSVGQLLSAAGMNISLVQAQSHKLDEPGRRAVAENATLVKQISDEIRTISYLLHPPLLDEAGLASALQIYVDGFAMRSKIKIEMDIPSDFGRLSSDLEIAIFRTVQECLTNIHRHSESSQAAIRIRQSDGQVVLIVEDSGIGMPAELLPQMNIDGGGVGFRGMRERLRQLGGTLRIDSNGNGTVVTATLPREEKNAGGISTQVA
jgi:PAS domain S-box-containing protein